MSDKFTTALRQLGHIYEPRTAEEPRRPVRHIEKCYVPTGELKPFCGADGVGIGCPDLWLDSNCEQCRTKEGLPASAMTKRSLMLDLVNIMCDIEQMWLDAMYWNYHNPTEEPQNPDPDGILAKAWIDNQSQLLSMMARFDPMMKRHEGRFGWPEVLDAGESQ